MNQNWKDKAWKLFEIAFYISLGAFVLTHWKSFLDWFIHFASNTVKAFVLLTLFGAIVLFIRKLFGLEE